MRLRLFLYGLGIWFAATLVFRVAGQYLLQPFKGTNAFLLFGLTFPLIAAVARSLCSHFQLPSEQRLEGTLYLLAPTLFLDPFSSAFFPFLFPNMAPETAGLFGGLMLWCCASAFTGAVIGRGKPQ